MSTTEITPVLAETSVAARGGQEITDLEAVCLFAVTGLFLTAVLVALGFGPVIGQSLT
jgi:hypothetical protein